MLVSDVFATARLWLSDPDTGSVQNPTGAEPRWDDASFIRYINQAIDKINTKFPALGLVDPTTYSSQEHISADSDALGYPDYVLEPLAHYLCWASATEDDSDKSNAEKAATHEAEWKAFLGER